MEQYISKSAVAAEIERRMASLEGIGSENYLHDNYPEQYAMLVTLKSLKFCIDTLEVREVDLEKESELIANEIMIEVQANKYHTNIYNTERNDFNHSHLLLAARKGIELGLKAQKGG